jgi:hypothetical protein
LDLSGSEQGTVADFRGSSNAENNVLFSKYNYNDQVKEDEMGRACSTNGGEEERI